MKPRTRYTLLTPLRHPLLVTIVAYLVVLVTGWGMWARFLWLEPVALAASDVSAPDPKREVPSDRRVAQLVDELAAVAAQNAALRQQLGQKADLSAAIGSELAELAIPARIIARGDASNWRHTIQINRGSSHGVKPGHIVTLGRTVLGVVRHATPHAAVVALVSDPSCSLPCWIVPTAGDADAPTVGAIEAVRASQNSRGVVRGLGGDGVRLPRLKLDDVSIDSPVKEGMAVVTNGSGGTVPAGLFVGRVTEVHHRNTFLDIELSPPLDVGLADVVTVIPHVAPELDAIGEIIVRDGARRAGG